LQQSQHAYDVNQKYAGRMNNPTFNVELDNLGNSKLKDLDGPTAFMGLSQEIPLNNKLALRKQLAGLQGNNNQFEITQRQAELKADFRICMSNWYAASQRAEIYAAESKLSARQATVLNEKLKYGRVIPSDVQLNSALSAESKLRYQNELKKVQFQKNLCSKFAFDLPANAIDVPLTINFTDKVSLSEKQALLKKQQAKTQFELAKKKRFLISRLALVCVIIKKPMTKFFWFPLLFRFRYSIATVEILHSHKHSKPMLKLVQI
jgi:hypothetical protein